MTPTLDPVAFGRQLKERRRSLGMSQADLGGERFTGSYISHLESGRRSATPEIVEFLATRLGVNPSELGMSTPARVQPVEDKAGIESLERLMVAERAWHDREWGTASELAAIAASSAKEAGQPLRHWEALYLQAQACSADGRWEEAANLALMLADHEAASRSSVLRAQALSLAGNAFRAGDQLTMAIACGAQAVEISSSAPPVILAEALMSLIGAMLETGRATAQTERLCRRLQDVALHVESEHAKGFISWTLGTAAYRAGDRVKGRALQEQALRQISPRRDLRLWVRLHRVIAFFRLDQGETEGVADMLAKARAGLVLVGNPYDKFELCHAEARLAALEGRYEESQALIEAALNDPELATVRQTSGRIEELLAEVLEAQGRLREAEEAYERAGAIYDGQDHFRLASNAWRRALDVMHMAEYQSADSLRRESNDSVKKVLTALSTT